MWPLQAGPSSPLDLKNDLSLQFGRRNLELVPPSLDHKDDAMLNETQKSSFLTMCQEVSTKAWNLIFLIVPSCTSLSDDLKEISPTTAENTCSSKACVLLLVVMIWRVAKRENTTMAADFVPRQLQSACTLLSGTSPSDSRLDDSSWIIQPREALFAAR